LCLACYNFAARNHGTGQCGGCGRYERLKSGYCRLCWCQAREDRAMLATDPRSAVVLAPWLAQVRHHQLFFADLNARRAAPRALPRRRGAKGRPVKPPPPAAPPPAVSWVQLPLDPQPTPRIYRTRVNLSSSPPPGNQWLDRALHLAYQAAEARGFRPAKRGALQRVLVALLAGHRDGEVILASDVAVIARRHYANIGHVTEIVRALGILDDDQPAAFSTWLDGKLDGMPAGIAAEAGRWARALHDGGARTKPRSEHTACAYLRSVRPALLGWSGRYDHLREVTRDDVLAQLDQLSGNQRSLALSAIRSLFGWAKANGIIFKNPAVRIPGSPRADRLWQPLAPDQIERSIQAGATPHARLAIALAAVHAARHGQIRALQLSDIDLANRRLAIAGRSRPLDDLTLALLTQWLDYRRSRWPSTANPHLLISQGSAVGLGPVSVPWIGRMLRGLPATIEQLRIDRQLEEALCSGADPLHMKAVFGMDDSTAIRYAATARQLLSGQDAGRTSYQPTGPGAQRSRP
jgi:hypothetical protein